MTENLESTTPPVGASDDAAVSVPVFGSNDEYVHWELSLVRRRIDAFLAVKGDPARLDEYYAIVDALIVERELGYASRKHAIARGVVIALEFMARRENLSFFDEEALITLATAHLSATLWQLLLHAQDKAGATTLEVGFLGNFLWPASTYLTDATPLEPHAPLLSRHLVVLRPNGTEASTLGATVHVPHYVARFLLTHITVDRQLEPYCEMSTRTTHPTDVIIESRTRQLLLELVYGLRTYPRGVPPPVPWTVGIVGPPESGKTAIAEALSTALARPLFTVHADRIPVERAHELLALAFHNARFVGAVLHLVRPGHLIDGVPTLAASIASWLRTPGFTVLEGSETLDPALVAVSSFIIDIQRPPASVRESLYARYLPLDHPGPLGAIDLPSLAATFDLTGGRIRSAIRWASRIAFARSSEGLLAQSDLEAGSRRQLRTIMDQLTNPSRVTLTLADLALPEKPRRLLLELRDACRFRSRVLAEWGFGRRLVTGRGIVALFAGEAGTGKTLAAEILAAELGQELRIASVPNIVSKYIGETEKNVNALFREARARGSILLFDEADALFGKRVTVERANDHFQNMEVNALLQEIERYEGIVLLTTNLDANMDKAFQRRILLRIDFPLPDPDERRRIWEMHIPREAPIDHEIDFHRLAQRFELSGGLIKNAAVQAAYRAYAAGTGLNQRVLEEASRDQIAAAGRLPPPMDY